MKKIVITEFMDLPAVESLCQKFHVVYDPKLVDDAARLMAAVAQADAVVVRNRTQVRGALLAACTRAVVIGRLGVGLDNIDVASCEARGIRVLCATGANSVAVAEYVIATCMVLLRGVYQSSSEVAGGAWPRAQLSTGRETAGKTLGLVGFGGIGRLTARLAQGLGMHVVAHDPLLHNDDAVWTHSGVESMRLSDVLARADVVSLHVPLTPDTRNLLSAERIGSMKKGAIVINTARGGIADEAALARAIKSGALGGAAIDVFDPEPLKAGNPWAACPNVILTPHVAGVTAEANARVSTRIAAEVARVLGA
ncbi:hydroxyacid dehydrogenase [Verminephrobacter aporrectodeae]|uniref:hydroxyacid dehydrogenase n=1 Tax=Verminephrobacter aporrectodeae TaxID=1110389 RepID=UPI0022384647|nr:hydroxyacid dehydrogenase [Verminephrobacter aporrectodeae]MCW5223193.1 3-phosphoglycerate dehydrogenase [Verminephrobacter aporrectodeae subsp. tuberculatae]MCW5256590.1 3-phosphoglycerate dehydrogenase [Verminephrobacter aporrectodeae subsp. tuberculatae]MCW5288657.1 3-phosphoglycerate dehydrogenase [Verminephrobacter aporrectodeae subsp. tuberculatae]MCW8175844.1 3-phosphoglycerate dehydrogenase [Verminephrobacter aporrectodeae subsp. tuberculatae]MCW8203537.1 3-phosphoglycerate dehydrog